MTSAAVRQVRDRDPELPGRLLAEERDALIPLLRSRVEADFARPVAACHHIGDDASESTAVVVVDQGEAEVDGVAGTRRREEVAVGDVRLIVHHMGAGELSCKISEVSPVRRGTSAVEESRGAEDERTGGDGDRPARTGLQVLRGCDEVGGHL